MSFKRQQDKGQYRFSRKIDVFRGSHYGYGRTDQPNEFAYVSDFDFFGSKALVRHGKRKNQLTGFPKTISSLTNVRLGGYTLTGVVSNGVLSLYPVKDMLLAVGTPVTWGELKNKGITWGDMATAETTWGDLKEGRRTFE